MKSNCSMSPAGVHLNCTLKNPWLPRVSGSGSSYPGGFPELVAEVDMKVGGDTAQGKLNPTEAETAPHSHPQTGLSLGTDSIL